MWDRGSNQARQQGVLDAGTHAHLCHQHARPQDTWALLHNKHMLHDEQALAGTG